MRYLIILPYLIISFLTLSQKEIKNLYRNHTTKQNDLTLSFKVLKQNKKRFFFNINKHYYWLKAQQVVSTQGAASGILLHGKYESFYVNHQLFEKGRFKKGVKKGKWMNWDEQGNLIHRVKYRNGKKIHKELFYNELGETLIKNTYHFTRNTSVNKDTTFIIYKFRPIKKQIIKTSNGEITNYKKWKNNELVPEKQKKEDGEKEGGKFLKFKKNDESKTSVNDEKEAKKHFLFISNLLQKIKKSDKDLNKKSETKSISNDKKTKKQG